jgi:hypothetical protein
MELRRIIELLVLKKVSTCLALLFQSEINKQMSPSNTLAVVQYCFVFFYIYTVGLSSSYMCSTTIYHNTIRIISFVFVPHVNNTAYTVRMTDIVIAYGARYKHSLLTRARWVDPDTVGYGYKKIFSNFLVLHSFNYKKK